MVVDYNIPIAQDTIKGQIKNVYDINDKDKVSLYTRDALLGKLS